MIKSNSLERFYRIERVIRSRYGIGRSKVFMNFCRLKNGQLNMVFYVFDSSGEYHMSTMITGRPKLGEVLEHIRNETIKHESQNGRISTEVVRA